MSKVFDYSRGKQCVCGIRHLVSLDRDLSLHNICVLNKAALTRHFKKISILKMGIIFILSQIKHFSYRKMRHDASLSLCKKKTPIVLCSFTSCKVAIGVVGQRY